MKKNSVIIGIVLAVIGGLIIYLLMAEETTANTTTIALQQETREQKISLGDATTLWGYYGVTPESPDEKRLCYARFPGVIDLPGPEKYTVRPVELWVCNMDGSGHKMLFKGNDPAHNGMQQSWVDNDRIVFSDKEGAYIINANTGTIEFGLYKGLTVGHFAQNGKVLLVQNSDSTRDKGLYELDIATGAMRLALPDDKSISHAQYSPSGLKVAVKYSNLKNLAVVNLKSGEIKVLPGRQKPMHFQWFDNQSFFGYSDANVVGIDTSKHIIHEMYRWNLDGQIIEHLSGQGCHGAARFDGKYFAGESWYNSDPIVLRLYSRGQRKALVDIFSHSFVELTWEHGGRNHVNPSFSRDGMRLYYNKAVNRNTSYAFSYDLTGLVSPPE